MVEFVIVVWIVRKEVVTIGDWKIPAYPCMHMMHQRVGHACCARDNPSLGYPGAPPYIL